MKTRVISTLLSTTLVIGNTAYFDTSFASKYTNDDFEQRAPGGVRLKGTKVRSLPSERIALVIGNNDYFFADPLKNPINDARAIAATLTQLSFKVTQLENANLTVMRDAIANFNRKLSASNQGIGLFYFAGHGVKSGSGLNYLIPIDFQLNSKTDLPEYAIDAETIRKGMEKSNTALNIAILDACRNDPFDNTTRNLGKKTGGLAEMQARGSLIALATAPGDVASDGARDHGTYTEALLKHMITPGIDIKEMFDLVAADVVAATKNEQRPWYHTSILGKFMFVTENIDLSPPLGANIKSNTWPTSTFNDVRKISINFAIFHDNGTNHPTLLKNGDTLNSGDGYFFHIKAGNADKNYFYLFQVDSSDKLFRLFPSQQYHTINNPVPANKRITLPNEREVFFLDDTKGKEEFYFLVADKPVAALEQLETGTIDDIMDAGFTLRGPAGVKPKTGTVVAPTGETVAEIQELSFSNKLVHTLSIKHE